MTTVSPRRQRISGFAILLTLVLLGITAVLAYRGWHYYGLSIEARRYDPDHKLLRPVGLYGNGYGWVAALLVVMNLSYLIRRLLASSKLGAMRLWLDIHVFTGMLSAVFVSFHSAFQLRNWVAIVAAASLAVVVVTGLIGRFLYALTPAADRRRLRAALDAMDVELPGHRGELTAALDALPGPAVPANASMLRSLVAIPAWRKAGKAREASLSRLLPPVDAQSRALRDVARELYRAAAGEARSAGMAALMRSWRGLHRFFALAMLAAVLLHAGIAADHVMLRTSAGVLRIANDSVVIQVGGTSPSDLLKTIGIELVEKRGTA